MVESKCLWARNKVLKEKQDKLQSLENQYTLHEDANQLSSLRKEINELLDHEDEMWNQRLRTLWIKHGDKNTMFFHAVASQWQRNNKINGLEDANGVWQESDEAIQDIISNYFFSIYRLNQPSHFSLVINAVETKVTAEMNDSILQAFQPKEIQATLQQMHLIKSLG